MASGSQKIREERMTAYEGMKAIMEKIGRGERLTVEERADFDARNRRITELEADLRTAEQAEKLAEEMRKQSDTKTPTPINPVESREAAFRDYLRYGTISPELRAMGEGASNMTSPGLGSSTNTPGYLVPPGWWQRLQVALKVYGGVARDFYQLETESGNSMQWATVDPTSIVGQIVGGQTSPPATGPSSGANENSQIYDVDYSFGQGVLSAYMYTSGVQKVSFQLANDSAFDIDGFVSDRVGESLGRAQANAAVAGTGSAQPLGVFPAITQKGAWTTGSSGGYITLPSASASTGADQSITFDGETYTSQLSANTLSQGTLRQMVAAVDPAYRALGAKFYMSDAQLLGLRGLVDRNGRPLVNLQDGLTPGAPSTLWGYEIVVDNNIPALTAGSVAGPVFGHLGSAMVLRTVTQSGILRLDQRYADLLQIGYIGYMRFDIRSNDLRAAVSVQATA